MEKENEFARVDGKCDVPAAGSTAQSATSDVPTQDEEVLDFLVAYHRFPDRATCLRVRGEAIFDDVNLIRSWLTLKHGNHEKPLGVQVIDGVLRIEIGVNTLAHAVSYSDWANPFDDEKHDYIRTFAILNAEEFAKDVVLAMQREEEDGSSPLFVFLDKASSDAVDDGSMACEYERAIAHSKTAPCETWASERTTSADYAVDPAVQTQHSQSTRDPESSPFAALKGAQAPTK